MCEYIQVPGLFFISSIEQDVILHVESTSVKHSISIDILHITCHVSIIVILYHAGRNRNALPSLVLTYHFSYRNVRCV